MRTTHENLEQRRLEYFEELRQRIGPESVLRSLRVSADPIEPLPELPMLTGPEAIRRPWRKVSEVLARAIAREREANVIEEQEKR
jgi:hypothetical protein